MNLTNKETTALQKIKQLLMEWYDVTVRKLQQELQYSSPRSALLLINSLIENGEIYRDMNGKINVSPSLHNDSYEIRNVPLIWTIACGMPIFAEENIETEIGISTKLLHPFKKYFLLRASGNSMNKENINDGDIVLIEETNMVNSGDIVVALLNDEATLKKLRQEWGHTFLMPRSTDPRYKPIILDESDESIRIQGKFIKSFPGALFS